MTTKTEFRWFWAWNDEKEEAWLRGMSQQGWHFQSVSVPGFFLFEQGEPTDYVYRLDYLIDRKDRTGYLQLFEDAGWDYLGEMGGWQYFRQKSAGGEAPEIYTDNESKAKKYFRLLLLLVVLFPVLTMTTFTVGADESSELMRIVSLLMAGILIFLAYAMVRLFLRMNQLRKRI